jgi:hypothetical protein
MPYLIPLAACCILAIGYMTFAVHYAEEAGLIHFDRPIEANLERPSVVERGALPPPSPIQEPPPRSGAGEFPSHEPKTGLSLSRAPRIESLTAPPRSANHSGGGKNGKKGRKGIKHPSSPPAARKLKTGQGITNGHDAGCDPGKNFLSPRQS